jgi:hypothetical protein
MSSALINVPLLERPSITSIVHNELTDENNYKELSQINHSLFPQNIVELSTQKPERTLRDYFQEKSRFQKELFTLNLVTPILKDTIQSRFSVAGDSQFLVSSSNIDPYSTIND